jgi:alanine dehydrogenase
MLVLSRADVEAVLTMGAAIAAVEGAMRAFSGGGVEMPPRLATAVPGRGIHLAMPAAVPSADPFAEGTSGTLGIKCITVYPGGRPAIDGLLLLQEYDTGRPLAVIDAARLTAVRTAAASAVATKVLARPGASTLALLGAGVQAESHLAAMACVRPLERVRVVAGSRGSAERFVREQATRFPDLDLVAAGSVREAIAAAELVCAVSSARGPIVERPWLAPGTHVNGVGSHGADVRELDGPTMRDAHLVCDSREAALRECGDVLLAIAEGLLAPGEAGDEVGEILLGRAPGRRSDDEITVYQSCGLAVQDVAVGRVVYEAALAAGRGVDVEL